MRTITIFLLLLTLQGCEISECDTFTYDEEEPAPTIVAKWELRKTETSTVTFDFPVGNGNVYSFMNEGTFLHFMGGVVLESGTYKLSGMGGCCNESLLTLTTYTSTVKRTIRYDVHSMTFLKDDKYPQVTFEKTQY